MELKLKQDASAEEPRPGESPETAPAEPVVSAPPGLEPGVSEQARRARRVWAILAGLAIVAAVCLLLVMAMQGLEMYGYGQPPSVWPAR